MAYDKERAKRWRAYVQGEQSAATLAQREFVMWWRKQDRRDPQAFKPLLIAKYKEIAYRYGLLAATVAAEYYEGERRAVVGEAPHVNIATINGDQVEAAVKYALGDLYWGDTDGLSAERRQRCAELFDGTDG